MAQEITMNKEVIETAEEVATVGTSKGLKIAGGVALAALAGVTAYKVGKKIRAAIKAKKAAAAEQEVIIIEDDTEASED